MEMKVLMTVTRNVYAEALQAASAAALDVEYLSAVCFQFSAITSSVKS